MPEPQELEGKFSCRQEDLEKLRGLKNIGDFVHVRQAERTQTDIYYDTATLALRTRSSSLRMRSADGTQKATFKGPRQAVGSAVDSSHLVKRLEIEVVIDPPPVTRETFLDRLDLEPVSRARRLLEDDDRPGPIARLVTHRQMIHFQRGDDEVVELSLDDVRARDLRNDRAVEFVEIELELIEGTAETLINAASSLCQAIPTLLPSVDSKLARTLGQTSDTANAVE